MDLVSWWMAIRARLCSPTGKRIGSRGGYLAHVLHQAANRDSGWWMVDGDALVQEVSSLTAILAAQKFLVELVHLG